MLPAPSFKTSYITLKPFSWRKEKFLSGNDTFTKNSKLFTGETLEVKIDDKPFPRHLSSRGTETIQQKH